MFIMISNGGKREQEKIGLELFNSGKYLSNCKVKNYANCKCRLAYDDYVFKTNYGKVGIPSLESPSYVVSVHYIHLKKLLLELLLSRE